MTPQKAVIVVVTLFLMVAAGFVFLYSNQQKALIQADLKKGEVTLESAPSRTASPKAVFAIQEQTEKLVEAAAKNPTPDNQEAARQAMMQTLDAIQTVQPDDNRTIEQKTAEMNALLDQIKQ